MSESYDVIIVGGGYAGLCCGLKLRGKKVLILEARKEIGRKHRGCQCGLYSFGESFDIEGDDIHFHKNNIRVPRAVLARLSALELVSGGHKIYASLKNPMPLVDEGKIKGTIENLCKEAGMDIITSEKVRSVETNGEKVSVYTDKKYDAKYLVGADGAHSRVIRYLPLERRRIGSFVELEVEAESMDIPDNGLYGEMKGIKVGLYAQPYGKGYMLGVYQGLGMKDKMIDLRGYLEESIKKLKVAGILRRYGCYISIHLSAPSSYHKNIIMTGDAVGSFSMITITGAMMMGLLAGEAVLKRMEGDAGAFKEYDKKWRKILQQGSIDGIRHFFFLFRRLNEKRMSRLFGVLGGSDLGFVGMSYYLKRIPGIIKAFF
jgi:flavin-dependent dehydrogenase